MKQLFAVSLDHGPVSAAAVVVALALSAVAAVVAARAVGAVAVLLPLVMVGYSAAAYLRRTADERERLLARVVAYEQSRCVHDTLLSLELARPLLPNRAWSASSPRRPSTGSDSTLTA